MSFLASTSTLRLLAVSLAVSGLALTGCTGQAGSTCQLDTDCSPGLTCSNSLDRANFPRGICGVGTPVLDAGPEALMTDAFSDNDASRDAFTPDAFVPTDAFVAPDAPEEPDAFVPSDAFTEADAAVADSGVDGG